MQQNWPCMKCINIINAKDARLFSWPRPQNPVCKKLIKMRAKKIKRIDDCVWSLKKIFEIVASHESGGSPYPPTSCHRRPKPDYQMKSFMFSFIKTKLFHWQNFSNYMLRLLVYRIYSRISQPAYKSNWKNIWPKMTKIPKI